MNKAGTKTCIYAFYYKPGEIIASDNIYFPVWAGKNNKPLMNGLTGDDSGENISEKNKYFSELTGIYWVWKNTQSDIVGSCHYRRYFTNSSLPFYYQVKTILYYPLGLRRKRFGLIYSGNHKYWKNKILSESEINSILETYDIILPVRRKLRKSVQEHYEKYHNSCDLTLLRKILEQYFPDYISTYETILKGNRLFANNMFVMPWETFDKLMIWLFFILFKFEEKTDLEHYKGYQERIFGFLSERLITLWVVHNNLNYKELPIVYFKKFKYQSNA